MQQLGEGRGGPLRLYHLGALLVRRQLAQHARRHALHTLEYTLYYYIYYIKSLIN